MSYLKKISLMNCIPQIMWNNTLHLKSFLHDHLETLHQDRVSTSSLLILAAPVLTLYMMWQKGSYVTFMAGFREWLFRTWGMLLWKAVVKLWETQVALWRTDNDTSLVDSPSWNSQQTVSSRCQLWSQAILKCSTMASYQLNAAE